MQIVQLSVMKPKDRGKGVIINLKKDESEKWLNAFIAQNSRKRKLTSSEAEGIYWRQTYEPN